jgi:hypothetical protein
MTPVKRVRYFSNQLLTAEDFNDEQSYYRHKQRLRNILILGRGVVSGLKVSVKPGQGGVQVAPGIAIDPAGNEIIVPETQTLPFPTGVRSALLTIRYSETPTDPVPVSGTEGGKVEATRIEEGFLFEYAPKEKDDTNSSVTIAKLSLRCGTWRIDRSCPCSLVTIGAVVLLAGLLSRLVRA